MNIEELIVPLRTAGTLLVCTTAVFGSVYYFKYKHTYLKYFLVLLWYTVFNEFLSLFLTTYKIISSSYILYNIYYFIYFSFLFILFKKFIKSKLHKKWISFFLSVYISSFLLFSFYQNYLEEMQNFPFVIASVFIVTSILFYYLEILNTNKVLYVSKNLLFWISIGLLLYFTVRIPTRIILNSWESIEFIFEIRFIEFISAFVTNICFIIGFIYSQKEEVT